MEKKVPERKVNLGEGDVFYVYDKRINKCVKEDCNGTVKYGLILKVNVTGEENCNCFECNKCHMKYTPYPNYVRISKPELLTIYNQEQVTLRDEKRAEDAKKQALREKRNSEPRRSFEKKSYDKKPYEKKSYDKKPYDKKPYDKKTYDKKPYENKPYEKRYSSSENRPGSEGGYKSTGYKKYGNVVITRGNSTGNSYGSNYNNKNYSKNYNNNYSNNYSNRTNNGYNSNKSNHQD